MHQGLQKRLPHTLGGLYLLIALEFLSPLSAQAQVTIPVLGRSSDPEAQSFLPA